MTADDGWTEFETAIEPLTWGRNTYTVLRLPADLEAAARRDGTRRVEGSVEGVELNVGLNRAEVIPDAFAYVGKALRRRLEASPGDIVRCRLRPVDPDHVPVAPDVLTAVIDAGCLTSFEQRSPAERRRLLRVVEDAATELIRRRRITALVAALRRQSA